MKLATNRAGMSAEALACYRGKSSRTQGDKQEEMATAELAVYRVLILYTFPDAL